MPYVKPTGVGVIIGRFQVADLTRGHDELLNRVARKHDKVVVLLGTSAKLSTKENPLGYESREQLLRVHWAETIGKNTNKKLIIAPLPNRATDNLWSKQIDVLLENLLGPMVPRTLYGGRDSCLSHYQGRQTCGDLRSDEEIELEKPFEEDGSATEQRKELFESPPMTEEGRAGAIWAMGNQWPRLDPCVDMAVTYEAYGTTYLLMGVKHSGVGKYCFPGGHVDRTDESAEVAAYREIKEETGLVNLDPWTYVCQVPVNDWRNTPTCQTWTTLFHVKIDADQYSAAVADDDLDEVHWVDIREVRNEEISPTHLPLFNALMRHLTIEQVKEAVLPVAEPSSEDTSEQKEDELLF